MYDSDRTSCLHWKCYTNQSEALSDSLFAKGSRETGTGPDAGQEHHLALDQSLGFPNCLGPTVRWGDKSLCGLLQGEPSGQIWYLSNAAGGEDVWEYENSLRYLDLKPLQGLQGLQSRSGRPGGCQTIPCPGLKLLNAQTFDSWCVSEKQQPLSCSEVPYSSCSLT